MKLYNYLGILILSVSLFSCDFLDETPYNKITGGNFYTTKEGIKSGVDGLYATLRGFCDKEMLLYLCEAPSDLWTISYGPDAFKTWTIESTNTNIRDFWNHCYISVNQCNEVIDALENYDIEGLSEELKDRYLGESKFIRSLYFYHLVQQFGDIPMPLTPTTSVITTAVKTPQQDVWEQILSDLKFVMEKVPSKYSATEYGRVTSYATKHFLSRVLLTVKRDHSDIQNALKYAEEVLSGSHALVSSHKELWDIENKRNEEVLFSVLFTKNEELNGNGNRFHLYFCSDYSSEHAAIERLPEYGHPWTRVQPTQFMMDLYDKTIDKRYEDCFQTAWNVTIEKYEEILFNPHTKKEETVIWEKGDLLLTTTDEAITPEEVASHWPTFVYLPEYMRELIDPQTDIQSKNNPDAEWPSNTRFMYYNFYTYLVKHLDPTRPYTGYAMGQRDFLIFRLGETYLLAAEAAYLLGDNVKAVNYLNVIRHRAAKPGKEAAMEINVSDLNIDFILNERAREMAGELTRWYDLKRAEKLKERMNNLQMNAQIGGRFEDYHVLRPIPRDQLVNVTNPEEFKQNPGYGD